MKFLSKIILLFLLAVTASAANDPELEAAYQRALVARTKEKMDSQKDMKAIWERSLPISAPSDSAEAAYQRAVAAREAAGVPPMQVVGGRFSNRSPEMDCFFAGDPAALFPEASREQLAYALGHDPEKNNYWMVQKLGVSQYLSNIYGVSVSAVANNFKTYTKAYFGEAIEDPHVAFGRIRRERERKKELEACGGILTFAVVIVFAGGLYVSGRIYDRWQKKMQTVPQIFVSDPEPVEPEKNETKKSIYSHISSASSYEKLLLYFTAATIIMLLAGLGEWKIGYYTFLRIITTISLAWFCFMDFPVFARFIFLLGAILYNPVFPIHLGDRDIWRVFNVITAAALLAGGIAVIRKLKHKENVE